MTLRAEKSTVLFKQNAFRISALAGAIVLATAGLTACNGSQDKSAAEPTKTATTQDKAHASDDSKMGKVIATIDGQPLYEENLKVIQESLHRPMDKQTLIKRMVELRLLAKAARAEGIDKDPQTRARIENAVDNQLANEYLSKKLSALKVPDEAIQKKYDEFVKGYPKRTEYEASHILVKTKAEAEKIIKQLDNGASFADLAKKDSIDPGSAKKGGDLGWFAPEQMVPEFSKAVEKLKKGEITQEPVKSKFGWHVIKLEDTRQGKPPSLAQLKPNLENQYRREQIEKWISDLRAKADVKLTDAAKEAPKKEAPAKAEKPASGS